MELKFSVVDGARLTFVDQGRLISSASMIVRMHALGHRYTALTCQAVANDLRVDFERLRAAIRRLKMNLSDTHRN